jgi:DNA polymerase-4
MNDLVNEFSLCLNCGRRCAEGGTRCATCAGRRISAAKRLEGLAIAHVDCDAFYAAIEKRDDPALADLPVIVGGGQRGVVTTACYIARTYGVRSAMPMFKALAACPDAKVIKPDFEKYVAAGRQVREMMLALTPLVEPVSIDEAFLDLGGTERLHGVGAASLLARLQADIKREIGITVSVGLSFNKFLAKLASDLEKPDGFTVIDREEAVEFIAPLSVGKIWGVGAVLEKKLLTDGIRTIGDLQSKSTGALMRRYGSIGGRLAALSHARDERRVEPRRETKSVSAETTFNADTHDGGLLEAQLWSLAEKVGRRMKEKNLKGRVVTLKLKTASFKSLTRRTTLGHASNLSRTMFETALPLLRKELAEKRDSYRLIGVGYSGLEPGGDDAQSELFESDEQRWARQENAIDTIRRKFGDETIGHGRNWTLRKERATRTLSRDGLDREGLTPDDLIRDEDEEDY